MKKYIDDFLSGNSKNWSVKHYMVYIPIAMLLGLYHSFLLHLIRLIF